jgi:N-glycosylase/DNA lyase
MTEWMAKNNDIIIKNLKDFDPVQTFECGQCFRWRRLENGNWLGVARGMAVELNWDGRDLLLFDVSPDEFRSFWHDYFDLGTDYGALKQRLAADDPVMERAVSFGSGIRLLRQDFMETLVSFIISQNNNIPRIKKIIECMSENFGQAGMYRGRRYFSFPAAERIASLSIGELGCIRAGYRADYIIRASRQIIEHVVDYRRLNDMPTIEARNEMLKLHGVGRKVADCILLYSGTKRDVFPVDRWVVRVMQALYPGCGTRNEDIAEFARKRFGDLAGAAQQYLFYYARENRIGVDSGSA